MAQKDINPYIYSDSNKRYLTYDRYMKMRFGGKVAKVPLDIGCTCPNIDGSAGYGGCIYCKNGSSSAIGKTIDEQYQNGVNVMNRKWNNVGYIPYFQSNSNTYGSLAHLEKSYFEAAGLKNALMVDIATRADCISQEVLDILERLSEKIPVTVELGLQTSNDKTADIINRCHSYEDFVKGYYLLDNLRNRINADIHNDGEPYSFVKKRFTLCIHIINGLPGEMREDMLKTVSDAAKLNPDMIKIHMLHILKGTRIADLYLRNEFKLLDKEEYVSITCDQIELLPPECVVARVTGDGLEDDLIAPLWTRRKTQVANDIDKELFRRNSYQGIKHNIT